MEEEEGERETERESEKKGERGKMIRMRKRNGRGRPLILPRDENQLAWEAADGV